MNKLILALFVLATIMPYEAYARGDGGTRLEKRAGYGGKAARQKRVATKGMRQKPVATKVKRGRTHGFTASAGKSCGTYMYWKDGRCQDARDKRAPWKAF
jgi:hypothetical protein